MGTTLLEQTTTTADSRLAGRRAARDAIAETASFTANCSKQKLTRASPAAQDKLSGEPRGVSPRISSSVPNGRQSSEESAGLRLAARLTLQLHAVSRRRARGSCRTRLKGSRRRAVDMHRRESQPDPPHDDAEPNASYRSGSGKQCWEIGRASCRERV